MENKHVILLDKNNNIVGRAYTFDNYGSIVTEEEYELANKYYKFNPETREFSEEIDTVLEELSEKQRIEQLEETIGILAEQVARQSLEA